MWPTLKLTWWPLLWLFMHNGPRSHSIHLQEQPAYLDLSSSPHWRPEQHKAYPERILMNRIRHCWTNQNFKQTTIWKKVLLDFAKKVSDKVTPKHLTLCPNETQDTRILWRIGQIGLLLPETEIPTSFVRNWPQASLKTTHMMMDGWQSNWDIHWEEAIMKCSWTKPYKNISV